MSLDGFLIAYGGAVIVPLAIIEGPVVSVAAGLLTAKGYFTWYWALSLLVFGDVVGDLMYYAIGRSGKARLGRIGRLLGANRAFTPQLQRDLGHNATRMLLIGKWTHSIGCIVLVGCGMMRMSLARFLTVSLLATIPKSAALFAVGYFAGGYLPFMENHAVAGTIVLAGLGVTAIAMLLRRRGPSSANGAPLDGAGR